MAQTYVNIVDLVEYARIKQKVEVFTTAEKLSSYTIETEKYFMRKSKLAGGVLQYLLRYIRDPTKEKRRNRVKELLKGIQKNRGRRLESQVSSKST